MTEANGRAADFAEFVRARGFHVSGDVFRAPAAKSELLEVTGEDHSLVVTISTPSTDRHGDVMSPRGARLDRYRRNPVVLYNHDYDGLPVGTSLWEKVAETGVTARPRFHLDTQLSREVWALASKGVLNAWSVGFLPEEWEPLGGSDGSGKAKGFRVLAWDLLEYSCVPVPANFDALTQALKAARICAPALVKSLAPLGLGAPDLVPSGVQAPEGRGKEKTMAGADTGTVDLKSLTVRQLEEANPDLVGQLKALGQEEEAAKAAAEKAAAEAEAAKTAKEKLAAAAEEGAKAERARLKALRETFPGRRDFALEQYAKGASLEQAEAAFVQVQLAELRKENARLKRKVEGVEPVGFEGEPDEKPHLERAKDYQAEQGGPEKCSITKALRATAPRRR